MKATPETLSALRTAMAKTPPETVRAHRDALATTPRFTTEGGYLNTRVIWDWFWYACPTAVRDTIPQLKDSDFNDSHLDTALRSIARELAPDLFPSDS
jgi:hypothetical protein